MKEHNVNVTWLPAFEGECHVSLYVIYYREVISGVRGQWHSVNVSHDNATHYNLQLQCYKEYEISLTAWTANGETPLSESKLLNVKTGGGNESKKLCSINQSNRISVLYSINLCYNNLWYTRRPNG